MQNIFWGLIFIMFNAEVAYDAYVINVIPRFLGYIIMYFGLKALDGKSLCFNKIKPYCAALTAYELVIWSIDACGLRYGNAAVFTKLVSVSAMIYITYNIAEGIGEIQKNSAIDLKYEKLSAYWKICVTLCALCEILRFVFVQISVVLSAMSFVFAGLFLIVFYKTKNKYYDNL